MWLFGGVAALEVILFSLGWTKGKPELESSKTQTRTRSERLRIGGKSEEEEHKTKTSKLEVETEIQGKDPLNKKKRRFLRRSQHTF